MIGLAFYFRSAKLFYPVATILYVVNVLMIQLNVIYYREFTDFMSVATMLGYNKVNQGLGASGFARKKKRVKYMRHYGRFSWVNTRLGFVLLLVALVWAKTQLANIMDFHLYSGASPVQYVTMLLNPLTVSIQHRILYLQ
ncbi:hypothetical protein H7R52_01315 [Weissella confusa]|uniref:Uncharacterized protein n=1 Tax=Weissella confusa TaxID=1583 RepID=A0A923NCX0_WEICO|nr:hypothetical protein [Weissella confusa]